MDSIFETIVRHENDHTNLLRNILDRYPVVAAVILDHLLGVRESAWDVSTYEYRTQSSFDSDDGRAIPDIRIEGDRFRCLIEVKVSPTVPFTKAQLEEYANCFEPEWENHLCYLVPREHREFQRHVTKDYEGTNGTKIHYRDWSTLMDTFSDELKARPQGVLLEAEAFWKRTFSVVTMTEAHMSFLSNWNGESYIAMRNLEHTIDQARKLFDVSEIETEAEMANVREYGFYLKNGKRYEMWIGIWADLDAPLLFGFHQKSTSWRRPSLRPTPDLTFKDYDLWRLGAETWGNPTKLFEAVTSFRDGLVYRD